MQQIAVYVVSIWKRMWKTSGYLAIFIVTPLLLIPLAGMTKKEDTQIRVAVCFEPPDEVSGEWTRQEESRLWQMEQSGRSEQLGQPEQIGQPDQRKQSEQARLFLEEAARRLSEKEGAVTFDIYDSEEDVKRQVAAKQAQCGYVFPTDLFERLDAGRYARSIKSYESPQTNLHTICDEVLFAEIFAVYERMTFGEQVSSYILSDQMQEGQEGKEEEQIAKRAEELFEKYLYNGSTFQFTYEDYGINQAENRQETVPTADSDKETEKGSLVPVRGIMALMIYLCGLCGTLDTLEDETAGRVLRLKRKGIFQILTIAAPVFVMSVIALFVFAVTGNLEGMGTEICRVIIYQVLLTIYCCILKKIWRNEEKFCGVIPVFALSAAVVCPVFVDLSVFLPVLKVMEKLYPVSYYLRM